MSIPEPRQWGTSYFFVSACCVEDSPGEGMAKTVDFPWCVLVRIERIAVLVHGRRSRGASREGVQNPKYTVQSQGVPEVVTMMARRSKRKREAAACKTDGKATLKPEKRSTDQVRMALVAHLASHSPGSPSSTRNAMGPKRKSTSWQAAGRAHDVYSLGPPTWVGLTRPWKSAEGRMNYAAPLDGAHPSAGSRSRFAQRPNQRIEGVRPVMRRLLPSWQQHRILRFAMGCSRCSA